MTNLQAIDLLKGLEQSLDDYCELNDEGKTAFGMAISALNCSEIPNNSDTISRQAALETIRTMQTYKLFAGDDMLLIDQAEAQTELMMLPPAQPEQHLDEWCVDCKEYDKEKHSCPRWNRVIRQTLLDAQPEHKTGHWIQDRSGAYCCNRCMEPCASYVMMKPRDKFCKMCGSRNEVME